MSEITAAIAWNDQLLNHHPEMDATHREFVDHLAQVQAALAGPQDALLAQVHQTVVDDAVLVWVVHDTNPHALSPKVKSFVQAQHWFQDLTTIGMVQ